jgi:hypothetical protein
LGAKTRLADGDGIRGIEFEFERGFGIGEIAVGCTDRQDQSSVGFDA